MTLEVVIGEPVVEIATGSVFKVLCSCPGSMPRIHTKRHIDQNPTLYRKPTVEELLAWQAEMSRAPSA